MNHALKKFVDLQRSDVVIIGDNMDTDIFYYLYVYFFILLFLLFCCLSWYCTNIIGGIEADIETVLLFSGVTAKSELHKYPFRPSYVFEGIGDIVGK